MSLLNYVIRWKVTKTGATGGGAQGFSFEECTVMVKAYNDRHDGLEYWVCEI